ncbi:hypothetical protein ABT095_23895 [Kitasatospora sp. NPDC002227]|uniref:hypothetical protein n=1 Tax=Kitasatospora sp. NPDC002227 TaxID=3154773 RepID=UPI003330017A
MTTERLNPLAGFWSGDFTLGPAEDEPEPPRACALAELGPAGLRGGGRDLAALLAPAYDRFTQRDLPS